jgi:hypothetical protein
MSTPTVAVEARVVPAEAAHYTPPVSTATLQHLAREDYAQQCSDILASPDVLSLFLDELHEAACVGEDRAASLLFIALASRWFKRPVSIAIKGPSAGGKSFTVDNVLRFVPKDAYYLLTGMSEKALAYLDEPLEHRYLVLYEAEGLGGAFASYLIRTLLSEGCIRYQSVQRTDKGMEPVSIYRPGPTGLITTTTRVSLHPENETRLLSLTVNDSPEQTRRVFQATVTEFDSQLVVDYGSWHAFHCWLESGPHDVLIPFGKRLAELMPDTSVRLRRDFNTLLALVKAHAILNQQNREMDDSGRIIALVDDYARIRELAQDLIAEGIERSVSPIVRETVDVVRQGSGTGEGCLLAEVSAALKIDRSNAYRRLQMAGKLGYLYCEGYPARWKIGDPLPMEEEGLLPEPESLI